MEEQQYECVVLIQFRGSPEPLKVEWSPPAATGENVRMTLPGCGAFTTYERELVVAIKRLITLARGG